MTSELLHQVREACKQQLLDTLMTLTRENGVDYNDYYRNEHGIDEDEGYTIVKVFDIACFGCHMALPLKWQDNIEGDTDPTPDVLSDEFGYHAYWSLYIERDETGYETLMLYQFMNAGVNWQSEPAEPDHSPASEMSLAELDYLTEAIYWHLRRDVENDDERLPEVTEPKEAEFFSISCNEGGIKFIHVWGYCYCGEDNGEGPWRNVEYTGFIEPLAEFIEHLKDDMDYVDNTAANLNQYIGDYTDDGIMDILNRYFDGHTANALLHYSQITIDTPCGDYMFYTE